MAARSSSADTACERFLADELTVIVLANRDDLDLRSLALEIAEAELGGH